MHSISIDMHKSAFIFCYSQCFSTNTELAHRKTEQLYQHDGNHRDKKWNMVSKECDIYSLLHGKRFCFSHIFLTKLLTNISVRLPPFWFSALLSALVLLSLRVSALSFDCLVSQIWSWSYHFNNTFHILSTTFEIHRETWFLTLWRKGKWWEISIAAASPGFWWGTLQTGRSAHWVFP